MPGRVILSVVALAAGAVATRVADAAPVAAETTIESQVVAADAAADHLGEECEVELVVRAARALADKDVCFLNSRRDRRDRNNFTAVIFKDGLARFRDAGVENPALHFLDRKIRVRGVVTEHGGRPQIVVRDPAQIELVEEPAEPRRVE